MTTSTRICLLAGFILGALVPLSFSFESSFGIFSTHEDLGVTPLKGAAAYDADQKTYRVTGGGANIWSKTDAFQFVYKQWSGDAAFSADVQFEGQGTEQHRKAALMFRQSLAADAAYADVALHGDGLTSLQYRPTGGSETLEQRSDVKAPLRIRIERHTDQFTISVGAPGTPLRQTGPVTVHLADPVYVGLALCSHNAGVLETAVFSNVSLESAAGRASGSARAFALLVR